jgi:hypothetical protein
VEVAGKKFAKSEEQTTKQQLTSYIEEYKAGSPTDPTVFWISQKPKVIARGFNAKYGTQISNNSVKRLLKELGYGYRKQSKQLATGHYGLRNEQFELIIRFIFMVTLKTPIISIDCKKKEHLGTLYRNGKLYCSKTLKVLDHDYSYLAGGKVIPHGIYDLSANKGYISIGSSHETADFITDNLLWWWTEHGIHLYPDAQRVLILCDAGGGNSYRHHIFKHHLLALAREIGLEITICHYPPYASKWNPIEHRLFCHVHTAIEGMPFVDYDTVKKIFENTQTDTGLTVVVRLNLKEYFTKQKFDKNLLDNSRIFHAQFIPDLNYSIKN